MRKTLTLGALLIGTANAGESAIEDYVNEHMSLKLALKAPLPCFNYVRDFVEEMDRYSVDFTANATGTSIELLINLNGGNHPEYYNPAVLNSEYFNHARFGCTVNSDGIVTLSYEEPAPKQRPENYHGEQSMYASYETYDTGAQHASDLLISKEVIERIFGNHNRMDYSYAMPITTMWDMLVEGKLALPLQSSGHSYVVADGLGGIGDEFITDEHGLLVYEKPRQNIGAIIHSETKSFLGWDGGAHYEFEVIDWDEGYDERRVNGEVIEEQPINCLKPRIKKIDSTVEERHDRLPSRDSTTHTIYEFEYNVEGYPNLPKRVQETSVDTITGACLNRTTMRIMYSPYPADVERALANWNVGSLRVNENDIVISKGCEGYEKVDSFIEGVRPGNWRLVQEMVLNPERLMIDSHGCHRHLGFY